MQPGRISQQVALLLVLATVHQLGASPCGCLEHSGWHSVLAAPVEHGSDTGEPQLDAVHCDHAGWPPALIGSRWSAEESDLAAAVSPWARMASAESPLAAEESAPTHNGCDTLSAQGVRAELQVYLL